MHITIKIILASLLVVSMGGAARAGTWRVEQAGTGDFITIQEAVDAAADGDTILIGPGHYQDMHEISQSAYTPEVVVYWEDARALTFIGVGADQVLLGPDNYNPDDGGPYGIFHAGSDNVRVSGISFQNFHVGIRVSGGCLVENCHFSYSYSALLQNGSGVSRVSNCEFDNQQSMGLGVKVWNATQFTIENCLFENVDFYFQGIPNALVTGCIFNGRVGDFVGSHGVFKNNVVVTRSNKALAISGGSQVLVHDCEFSTYSDGARNLVITEIGTYAELKGNVFNGGIYTALHILFSPTVVGSGNHFLKGSGTDNYTIWIQEWSSPIWGSIDLRKNYWGTDDPEQVALWIFDGIDDPDLAVEVQYLPIEDGQLPTESVTLDGLKAMYRGAIK